jgi:hypothetical protein
VQQAVRQQQQTAAQGVICSEPAEHALILGRMETRERI